MEPVYIRDPRHTNWRIDGILTSGSLIRLNFKDENQLNGVVTKPNAKHEADIEEWVSPGDEKGR